MFKHNCKRVLSFTLASAMMITSLNLNGIHVNAAEKENLALGKGIEASYSTNQTTFAPGKATDGNMATRWASEGGSHAGTDHWLLLDLGGQKTFNQFYIASENNAAQKLGKFKIEGSNDTGATKNFTSIYASPDKASTGGFPITQTVNLDNPVTYQYVRLTVEKLITNAYASISIAEFQIFNVDQTVQDPNSNIAQGKTATVSSIEDAAFPATQVVDGNLTTRWACNLNDTPWVIIDFGKEQDVRTIKLFWERKNAINYDLQIANPTAELKEADWQTVKSFTSKPTEKNQKIVLNETQKARYFRLKINDYASSEEGSTVVWKNLSLFEIEVYGGVIKADMDDVVSKLTIDNPTPEATKLDVSKAIVNDDFDITYNGTDYEQIIGSDLTIYKPVVDTKVKVSFKVSDKTTKAYKFKEVEITVPGKFQPAEGDNAKPTVLPALQEWKGNTGNFSVTENSKVIVPSTLKDMAETFAEDYKDVTGKTLTVAVDGTANANDFTFSLTTDKSKGLQKEGYLMDVSADKGVVVEAETETGAFWATRTILQILKANDKTTIPTGLTRDYPLYKVRGIILDVARKPFSFDWVQQLSKEMSWYKMNDFQIHLNDNYIFLEEYTNNDELMNAYSAFRLESGIKKGGLNKADLTSTDTYYTKEEFKNFIKDSRKRGVNIVPEIDTPAHSLALTKVRPDLRLGLQGRQNDHLDLKNKYDESLSFVQSIFSDYMGGSDPVFDKETMIHVGADEFNGSSEAYRKFCNDMFQYVKDTGRKSRVWGSLTQAATGEPVNGEGVEIDLWNFGYANMDKMYDAGFDLINCNDGNYYIVPNAGYYYDYLNPQSMYNATFNSIGGVTIPAGDKQMVGAAYALWNDMIDKKSNGMCERDIYDRLIKPMPYYAANVWGKDDTTYNEAKVTAEKTGTAPNTNLENNVVSKTDNIEQYNMNDLTDSSTNHYDLKNGKNAEIKDVDYTKALELKGKESYVSSPIKNAGLGNDLRLKVKRTSDSNEEQILFESDGGSIKAVQKDTGKVGFSRELYDYSFNYELPINVWVELEIKNVLNETSLYVNGELVDVLGDNETAAGRPFRATLVLPTERIGSKTNAFKGFVKDVRLSKAATYASTVDLDLAALNARYYLKTNTNKALEAACDEADALRLEYAPAAASIAETKKKIDDIMKTADFEKADYSEIDALIKIVPSDEKLYTPASYAQYKSVLDGITRNLSKSMQSSVDGYKTALAKAISRLVLKEAGDLLIVDSSTLKATASSEQGGSESASSAIDKDPSTMWHTAYNNKTMPHSITLELAEETVIGGLNYLPRENGGNGNIKKYEIYVSTTDKNDASFKKVANGDWANNDSMKKVTFTPENAKYVKLVATEAVGNFASAAEIELVLAIVTPDKDGLRKAIDEAKALSNTNEIFSTATWEKMQSVIEKVEKVFAKEDADANEVTKAINELLNARLGLSLNNVKADKTELTNTLKLAKEKEAEGYSESTVTPSTWKSYTDALKVAKALDANDRADASDIAEAVKNLVSAINALTLKATDKQFDELKKLVSDAENIYGEQTDEIFASLKTFVQNAKTTLDASATEKNEMKVESLQTQIDSFNAEKKKVEDAIKSLSDTLTNSITDANNIDTNTKKPSSVVALTNAISEAEKLIKDNSTNIVKLTEANTAISNAINGLVDRANNEGLVTTLDNAKAKNKEDYSGNSYEILKEAMLIAKTVIANGEATAEEIAAADASLKASISGLVLQTVVDDLEKNIAKANMIFKNINNYKPETVKELENAITNANTVLENKQATTKDFEDASNVLSSIIKNAELIIKKDELSNLIKKVEALKSSDYTKDTWDSLQSVVVDAKKVMDDANATQEQIDAIVKTLQTKVDELKKVITPVNPTPTTKPEEGKDKEGDVNTWDSSYTSLLFTTLVASAFMVSVLIRKRNMRVRK